MNDDELRRLLADAHRDDAPPPFRALAERRPRRRLPLALAPVGLAIAVVLAILTIRPAPPPTPSLYVESRGPLDFLLRMPGDELLHELPRFDEEGDLP
jgi:hypothetical protein